MITCDEKGDEVDACENHLPMTSFATHAVVPNSGYR